jgi:hypothetical protein
LDYFRVDNVPPNGRHCSADLPCKPYEKEEAFFWEEPKMGPLAMNNAVAISEYNAQGNHRMDQHLEYKKEENRHHQTMGSIPANNPAAIAQAILVLYRKDPHNSPDYSLQ